MTVRSALPIIHIAFRTVEIQIKNKQTTEMNGTQLNDSYRKLQNNFY